MIKRSHVRQFLAVVDAGSFTQAAARIRITQPSLSVGIAELERLVGAQLLVRDRRHVRLTEAGGRFLPVARAIENNFREADKFGDALSMEWPEIKLGLIRTLPEAAVQALVRSLANQFSIELIEGTDGELRAELSNGRINMMIGLIRRDEDTNDVIELIEEPYLMLASASHPLACDIKIPPEKLASEVMIVRRNCEVLDETSRFFTRHRVRPRFALRSHNEERCMRMVAAGLGITNAPASLMVDGTVPLSVVGYTLRRRVGIRMGQGAHERIGQSLAIAAEAFRSALAMGHSTAQT